MPAATLPEASSHAAFGSVPAPFMVVAEAVAEVFGEPRVEPFEDLALNPFTHALHYGSSCFEGLKAHRGTDGAVRLFRHEAHVDRMRRTAEALCLPVPPARLLDDAIRAAVARNLAVVPEAPGSLYLRPLLLGTDPTIGAAAAPSHDALLLVLASPVGDYFAAGERGLKLSVETELPRTTPQFGQVKTGANYVMALPVTRRARAGYGVDQVLFAPGGDVQETGASNFLLLDDDRVITRSLDGSFLHGVTRDAVLTLARDLGYHVEERRIDISELLTWPGEAALSGTAAGMSGVTALVHEGTEHPLSGGEVGASTLRLRHALQSLQRGERHDPHGWTTVIS